MNIKFASYKRDVSILGDCKASVGESREGGNGSLNL